MKVEIKKRKAKKENPYKKVRERKPLLETKDSCRDFRREIKSPRGKEAYLNGKQVV